MVSLIQWMNAHSTKLLTLSLLAVSVLITARCSGDSVTSSGCTTSIDGSAPTWVIANFGCVTVTVSGGNLIINTDNIPNHNSYYFGSSDSRYEALPSGNSGNPNSISSQNITITVSATPSIAGAPSASSLGSVGFTTGGVSFYNNQAAPGDTLANELTTMDQGGGHPTDIGAYHHHTEPLKISSNDGRIVGIMADGFPIFGRLEADGSTPTYTGACTTGNALTVENCRPHATVTNFHCHTLPSSSYGQTLPDGSSGASQKCHYHVLSADPYVLENYAGTPGTISF